MPRETVRFEDEEDFQKEIWRKVFSRVLKKDNPESFILHFFSPEKLTRLFLLIEVQPSPDRHKMIKRPTLDNLFPPLRYHVFPPKWRWFARARTTERWENLFLVVLLVLERFNKWQELNNENTRQLKN